MQKRSQLGFTPLVEKMKYRPNRLDIILLSLARQRLFSRRYLCCDTRCIRGPRICRPSTYNCKRGNFMVQAPRALATPRLLEVTRNKPRSPVMKSGYRSINSTLMGPRTPCGSHRESVAPFHNELRSVAAFHNYCLLIPCIQTTCHSGNDDDASIFVEGLSRMFQIAESYNGPINATWGIVIMMSALQVDPHLQR